jgi:hypothetical protein
VIHALLLPIRTVSETNQREHWAKRHRRRADQRSATLLHLRAMRMRLPSLPVRITLTRVAPRKLDDDNLRGALKAVRDGVADWLELDDADEHIEWCYAQRRAERPRVGPSQYAVEVTWESC